MRTLRARERAEGVRPERSSENRELGDPRVLRYLPAMGNDNDKQKHEHEPVKAELEHDDAFQVLADLGRDLAAGATRIAETVPTEKVQNLAQKAVFLGHATAQVAGKAREVADEVRHLGGRGREAVDRLEEQGVPVRKWWEAFGPKLTTDPLPTNRGPDVHVGPAPRAEREHPRVKVTLRAVTPEARPPVEDERGVVSPSDPRR